MTSTKRKCKRGSHEGPFRLCTVERKHGKCLVCKNCKAHLTVKLWTKNEYLAVKERIKLKVIAKKYPFRFVVAYPGRAGQWNTEVMFEEPRGKR